MFYKLLALSFVLATCTISQADGNSNGGDDFRSTANQYQSKAAKYRSQGKSQVAALYTRLAAIKRNAASLADQNRWDEIDWSEYHTIEAQINQQLYAGKGKHK